jgi:hypothetical protein
MAPYNSDTITQGGNGGVHYDLNIGAATIQANSNYVMLALRALRFQQIAEPRRNLLGVPKFT